MAKQELVNPLDKEKINKEGWEGGAAVIIGSRKELDLLRENLETGGICKDATTYVRRNKKIIVPAERVPENIKKQAGKGWIGNSVFIYIDKMGNIAQIDIDYDKISSIKNKKNPNWEVDEDNFVDELRGFGFDIKTGGFNTRGDEILKAVNSVITVYRDNQVHQAEVAKKQGFNF